MAKQPKLELTAEQKEILKGVADAQKQWKESRSTEDLIAYVTALGEAIKNPAVGDNAELKNKLLAGLTAAMRKGKKAAEEAPEEEAGHARHPQNLLIVGVPGDEEGKLRWLAAQVHGKGPDAQRRRVTVQMALHSSDGRRHLSGVSPNGYPEVFGEPRELVAKVGVYEGPLIADGKEGPDAEWFVHFVVSYLNRDGKLQTTWQVVCDHSGGEQHLAKGAVRGAVKALCAQWAKEAGLAFDEELLKMERRPDVGALSAGVTLTADELALAKERNFDDAKFAIFRGLLAQFSMEVRGLLLLVLKHGGRESAAWESFWNIGIGAEIGRYWILIGLFSDVFPPVEAPAEEPAPEPAAAEA